MRIDHLGDHTVDDNVYMWLSPDPTTEPLIGAADVTIIGPNDGDPVQHDYSNIDFIRPFIGDNSSGRPHGEFIFDEYRLGTTYADMTSTQVVPEPASLLLVALSGLALFGGHRRVA